VRFYSSNDCTSGSEMAESDEGCIGIDGEIATEYLSFNVVKEKIPISPRDPPPVALSKREQRMHAERARSVNASGSVSLVHGQSATFAGTAYRWQQIHVGGFVGINPDEWDDDIHVQSDAELPELPANSSLHHDTIGTSLDERNFLNAVCQTTVSCSKAVAKGGVAVADAITPYFAKVVAAAAAASNAGDEFLKKHPFVALCTIGKSRRNLILADHSDSAV